MSREMKVLILDAAFATLTMGLTLWLSPENLKYALGLVAVWQPVVYAIVKGEMEVKASLNDWTDGYKMGCLAGKAEKGEGQQ